MMHEKEKRNWNTQAKKKRNWHKQKVCGNVITTTQGPAVNNLKLHAVALGVTTRSPLTSHGTLRVTYWPLVLFPEWTRLCSGRKSCVCFAGKIEGMHIQSTLLKKLIFLLSPTVSLPPGILWYLPNNSNQHNAGIRTSANIWGLFTRISNQEADGKSVYVIL